MPSVHIINLKFRAYNIFCFCEEAHLASNVTSTDKGGNM